MPLPEGTCGTRFDPRGEQPGSISLTDLPVGSVSTGGGQLPAHAMPGKVDSSTSLKTRQC